MTAVIIICAAALVAFAIYRTIQKFRGKASSSCCGTPEVRSVKKVEDTDKSHYPYHYTLSISGMHCSNCARTIENELNSMDGVWSNVDLGRNQASVLCKSEMTEGQFSAALAKNQYKLTGFKVS